MRAIQPQDAGSRLVQRFPKWRRFGSSSVPANFSSNYKRAERAFKQASDLQERRDGLREMLRTIAKHKGIDHLQADIKSRIKQLRGP